MTFIQQFEAELAQKLDHGADNTATIVRWAAERVLESYRNGIAAGQKGAKPARKGQNRNRDFFGKKAQ
jgi:hypothetical protein